MDYTQVVEIGIELVRGNLKHQDYARTVELSENYRKVITSVGLEDELKKTSPSTENEEAFKKRLEITQFTTKSVANNIIEVFYEVGKSDDLSQYMLYDGDKDEEMVSELSEALKSYAGPKSLNDMLGTDLVDIMMEDPNAFIATVFDPFDNNKEKAKPYPVTFYSEDIYDFAYKNYELQYLTTHKKVKKRGEKRTQAIDTYFIYHDYINIEFIQRIDSSEGSDVVDTLINENGEVAAFKAGTKVFDVFYYRHDTGYVPAFRVGYKPDRVTRGRTMVSAIDPAMPYFWKSIKVTSELDISVTKNAHPQKYHYVGKEFGRVKDIVDDINSPDVDSPNSALEKTTMELQRNARAEDVVDLSKMVYYHYMPTEFIKWLEEYTRQVNADCKKAVFNSDTFERDTTVSTATEKRIERQEVNSTLKPFADKFSESFKYVARLVGSMLDNPDDKLEIFHSFRGEFKTVSVDELVGTYKTLTESNAPAPIKEAITKQILEIQYKDDPNTLSMIDLKSQHMPFRNFSSDQIIFALSSGDVPQETSVLYNNFDTIFDDLVSENPDFIDLPYKKRKEGIDKKVADIIERVNQSRPLAVPASFGLEEYE